MSGLRKFPAAAAGKQPARNDPCPCGSGLKYKQCCAMRPRATQPATQTLAALGPLTDFGRQLAVEAAVTRTVRETRPQAGPAIRPGAASAAPGSRPPTVADCLREANRLGGAGRVADAIPLLEQAARLDPGNARIRVELGRAQLAIREWREAAGSFARAIQLDPKLAVAQYNLGVALTEQGRVTEAIIAYRAAIARTPNFADAHFQLGELLFGRLYIDQAAEAFDRAAVAQSGTTRGRLAAGRALMVRDRPEEAMAVLHRALAIDPKSVELRRLVAKLLIEAGRFDEAEQQYAQSIALDPRGGAFDYFQLTKSRKMTPAHRPMLNRMTTLLQAGGITDYDRMVLHFGLGKAHDDLHEFEAAMRHFDAANRIRGGSAPLDRPALVSLVDRNIELFPDKAAFDASLGVDDERPVFILGLPRSGTTLTEQILSSHPAVAAGGELGYWGEHAGKVMRPGAGPFNRDRLHELVAGYQALLRGISPEASRLTDKNPFNFLCLGMVRLALPQAFIIHCRRHPVDNCLSMYMTFLGARETYYMGNRDDLVFYHGQYSRLMRHWREVLPPGRFLEVDYEAMTGDSEQQTRRLVSFCELEWDDACLRPEGNRRTIGTASVWQARQPVYRSSVERWRNYEPWLGPLADLLSEAGQTG